MWPFNFRAYGRKKTADQKTLMETEPVQKEEPVGEARPVSSPQRVEPVVAV